jgi:dipeptidyl aminopeptidase/acylaminoacyl peptidase
MRRRILCVFTFLCTLPFSLAGQTKRPFTFEDLMALKRVSDPQPSPDGKWVLFSVTDVSLEANSKIPHVWVVPTAGGELSEIIFTQESDRPRWSPEGKHFAFVSTKEGGSQIWIADFDGEKGTVLAVHKLTSIATEASGELWSPDGKNILFTSDIYPECDGAPQAEADCNAKKLKEVEQSKVKALIFTSLLYRHWNAYKGGKRSHIFLVPVDACVGADASSAQPGAAGQTSNAASRASLNRTDGGVCPYTGARDLTPGDFDAPVFSLGGQDNYAFSPDGQEIAYSSNHDKVEAISTNNDIWLVSVNGGAAKNITADNPASDSTPLYSPDGKYIAYRAQQRPGYEADRFRLMLYNRKTGERKNLTPDFFDMWVGSIAWASDASKIYLTAEKEGRTSTYFIELGHQGKVDNAKPGQPTNFPVFVMSEVTRGFDDDVIVTSDGKTLLFTRMSLERPSEIQKLIIPAKIDPYDLPVGDQLTHITDPLLSQVSMSPLESFWFEGAKGDKVQGFLVKPPNFDPNQKYPVKFLIHGGPQGAWGDDWSFRWNPELFASPTPATPGGYVVVMINFHGSTGYGQKFIDEINGNWGGAPFEDLMKGLDYAEKTYPFIDKDRECALGASYGGYMANWILGHTDRFKCIVSHDGMFNSISAWGTTEELWFNEWEYKGTPYSNREMYEKWSPNNAAKNFKTPTLVVHGQLDYRLDVSEGLQLFTTLQRERVPSKMLYFPDEGHWVLKPQNSQIWYKTVNDWVDQWTKSSH